jgi:pilus assembly protein Flp/PilA
LTGAGIFTDATVRRWRIYCHGERRMSKFVAFLKNEKGATAIEYGLIASGISVAIIAIVNTLGTQLNTNFTSVSTQLK